MNIVNCVVWADDRKWNKYRQRNICPALCLIQLPLLIGSGLTVHITKESSAQSATASSFNCYLGNDKQGWAKTMSHYILLGSLHDQHLCGNEQPSWEDLPHSKAALIVQKGKVFVHREVRTLPFNAKWKKKITLTKALNSIIKDRAVLGLDQTMARTSRPFSHTSADHIEIPCSRSISDGAAPPTHRPLTRSTATRLYGMNLFLDQSGLTDSHKLQQSLAPSKHYLQQ